MGPRGQVVLDLGGYLFGGFEIAEVFVREGIAQTTEALRSRRW